MKTITNAVHDPALTFIFAKDIQRVLVHITTYKGAWLHLKGIRDSLGKARHQRLTVKEFADYEGLPPELVMQKIDS